MVWAKLDDGFYLHPKILRLSDGAYRLYVQALNYSCAQLTDGRIDGHVLGVLLPGSPLSTARRRARELTDADLWREVPGGWEINDFHEYQPSRESVMRKRDQKRAAGALGNHRRWHGRKLDPNCPFCQEEASQVRSQVRSLDVSVERSQDRSQVRGGVRNGCESHAIPPEPEPEPEPVESPQGETRESGKGGSPRGGGTPRGIDPDVWRAALQLADERIAQGYEPDDYLAFATHIARSETDQIRARILRRTPTHPDVAELVADIGHFDSREETAQ